MKAFPIWICVAAIFLLGAKSSFGHITEILVDDDETDGIGGGGGKANSIEQVPPEDSTGVGCHVEFQVMKRVLGHCVRLGHNSRGCVAGTYLHPFHPECM